MRVDGLSKVTLAELRALIGGASERAAAADRADQWAGLARAGGGRIQAERWERIARALRAPEGSA